MPALHQLVAGYTRGDAISNEARALREMFRRWGFASEIYCEPASIHPELRRDGRPFPALAADLAPHDVLLLHLSIGSPVNDLFPGLCCRKAIRYHNITPPEYFEMLAPRTAEILRRGRNQVKRLAGAAAVNLAVSRYNAAELEAAGYANVRVLPIVLDFSRLDRTPDPKVLRAYGDRRSNVLFVGRCAPNKAIDDLVRLFACFQKHLRPDSRLLHVGAFQGMEAYHGMVRILARNLGLHDVHFLGAVSQAELAAFYRVADVLLCPSEHEGFCIPLLEAMYFDVPVLAYAAGAVPETMDGSGILFHEKRAEPVAEMVERLLGHPPLREAVLEGQRRRLQRYRERDLATEFRDALAPLLSAAS